MKNIFTQTIVLGIIIVVLAGCRKLSDINQNPNNPTETSPALLLTTASWDVFSDHLSRQDESRMLVVTDGESADQFYKWTRDNFNDYDRLRNIHKMEEEAIKIGSKAYQAIAKFYKAYYYYELTLTFGDVPFSESLQGESDAVYKPKYDSQEKVFAGVLELLKEANELLSGSEEVISGDILNEGDLDKWQKLVNAYRLKVLLTLSHKTTVDGQNIPTLFANIYGDVPLMTSLEDATTISFLDQAGSRYRNFNSSGFGSGLYNDSTFVQQLIDRKDPRLFIYCTQTPNAKKAGWAIDTFAAYEGGNPIVQYSKVNDKAGAGDISKPHPRYYEHPTCEDLSLLGYPEQQFIIAEAIVRGWISGDAKAEYEKGIEASFKFFSQQPSVQGTEFESFLTTDTLTTKYLTRPLVDLDKATTDEKKIEYIITQKYLQSYYQTGKTPLYENMRTGYPEFITVTGVTVPYRWMYPQRELDYNNAAVTDAISRQFGGNDDIRKKPWYLRK